MVAGQRRRAKRNSRPFFPRLLLHWGLAFWTWITHAGRDCPRSAPRCIRHLQLAGPTLQQLCGTLRLPRLPAYPHPSIHPFTHSFTSCLVYLPVVTYQPIPSHLSCACAALRCSALPIPIPIPFIPSLVIPASLFSTLPSRSWSQRPRKKLPSPSVDRCRPPTLHLPRYSTGRSGSTTPRPCSSSHLPSSPTPFDSARLDRTAPTTNNALSAASIVSQAVHPPSNPSAYRGNHQAGIRYDHIHRPGGRTSAPTRPSLASIQA